MKKMMKKCSVFHIEQKMEFEKFNCFFIIRLYTRQKLSDFYILRSFIERYFLTDYSYILENHFYFVNVSDYCFKPSLSRIFFLNSSVKVLSPQYIGPSAHIFRTSSVCTLIVYRKKEIGRFRS